jgi:hypothetical protein
MIIELTVEDIKSATQCGEYRQSHNESRIRDQKVSKKSSLEININGAKAELSVVKATGYEWNRFTPNFWKTPRNKRPADVGPIEVRTNNSKFNINMLLYQKNGERMRPYMLVIPLDEKTYQLKGWRFGFECEKKEFWKPSWKKPCYAVPEYRLYSLRSLKEWCNSHLHAKWISDL